MIKLIVNNNSIEIPTTKFPDGTSQVWKINKFPEQIDKCKIDFIWENNEFEILQVLMLIDLIKSINLNSYIHLNIPYLPYARQDKEITNETTFALYTFSSLINSKNLDLITSFDVHSNKANKLIKNFISIKPENFHIKIQKQFQSDIIFYPDKGAAQRYSKHINEILFYGEKIRNQLTGQIEGYKLINVEHFDLENKNILIIDDICDGGATFITAATELIKLKPKKIGLCVSHGIFSKGFEELIKSGISEFYTTNSLLKNPKEFDIIK